MAEKMWVPPAPETAAKMSAIKASVAELLDAAAREIHYTAAAVAGDTYRSARAHVELLTMSAREALAEIATLARMWEDCWAEPI